MCFPCTRKRPSMAALFRKACLEACPVRFHLDACHSFTPYVELALKKRCSHPFPGGHSGVVPPDPIPNSEVKRACADGSVALPCKSRSPPGALHLRTLDRMIGGFVFYGVAAARKARELQQVTARGLTPQNPRSCDRGILLFTAFEIHAPATRRPPQHLSWTPRFLAQR